MRTGKSLILPLLSLSVAFPAPAQVPGAEAPPPARATKMRRFDAGAGWSAVAAR